MNHDCEDAITFLTQKLQEKHSELTGYRRTLTWRLYQGEASEAYKASFDDSSWQQISLPASIDVRKGEAWLRTQIVVPKEIAGVEVMGSTAKISASPILDKVEVFVNSEKTFSADYWSDFRDHKITLCDKAKPGMTFSVAIHLYPKYEPISVQVLSIAYSQIEKIAFEIDSFIHELRFTKFLDNDLAYKVSKEFNYGVFEKASPAILKQINEARVKLLSLTDKAKEFKVHLVAHAHIDMNWLWPWQDTIDTIKETFSTMIKLMNKYPDFHFSQSQAVTYKIVEERFPELFEAIRRHVEKGTWDVTASMWTEADLNMAGTEALIRQFLEAKRYVREKFGVEPEVCWEPDTFGHISTLPQIIRRSCGKYYYFMRCGKGHPLFWWKSPDGSKVLAFTSVYNNTVNPKNITDLAIDFCSRYGLKTTMFIYGVGNHGGGATVEDIETAHAIQEKSLLPSVVFSSTHRFFNEVEEELSNERIPVIDSELQYTFDGCYTTHSDIKRFNRLCERLLVDAEKFSTFSGSYTRETLRKAWQNTLFNEFHDILDGSGTSEAYLYPRELAEEALKIADEALQTSLRSIVGKIRFFEKGVPIVVFNQLSWTRTDLVRLKVPKHLLPQNPVVIPADDGGEMPVQVIGDEILFVAEVPSLGYKTYYLVKGGGRRKPLMELSDGQTELENERFKLQFDKDSGTISLLHDKVVDRPVIKKNRYPFTRPIYNNLLQVLYELPHKMSAWIIGDISRTENLIKDAKVELVENGPVRATMKVSRQFNQSTITQFISVCRGLPRIDLRIVIDWKEASDDRTEAPMLKVSFTPILASSKATYEIPFGYVERPADGIEVPALRWVDVSDGEYGLSLLNDSKYGFDVKGNTVRMTLLRTSYSPDPKPDQGIHEIKYVLYPHEGSWKEALTFRKGYELNHPLEAYVVTKPTQKDTSQPQEASYVQVSPENVVVSSVKAAEDSEDCIIRVYDATGAGAKVKLLLGFDAAEVCEVDLMEREVSNIGMKGKRIEVSLSPFEVKTLRVKLATKHA